MDRMMGAEEQYLQALIAHGLLIPMGVDGVYGRSAVFEDVLDRFGTLVGHWGAENGAEAIRFPPVMNRQHFEHSGYMKNFPQLAGTIHSFCGGDKDHQALRRKLENGEDWTADQKAIDIVVTPAACYSLYPMVAQRGVLPAEGALFDVYSWCLRHEPSLDPARMQLFRMREYVWLGTPEQVSAFREAWIERGRKLIESLQLPATLDVANDPFFGRQGKLLASSQRELTLKFELLIPITSTEKPTACLSFNYAQDYFGELWRIRTAAGEPCHSACVAFGMERIALALFKHHGFDPRQWPADVRRVLWN
jgi:seryl-tRNA synthetase